MKISEWFDPKNINHIKGYQHLRETGSWPEKLYEEIMKLEDGIYESFWRYEIAAKMSQCWIERFIQDHKNDQLVQELLTEMDEEEHLALHEEQFYNTEHSKE